MQNSVILFVATLFSSGVLLQLLGCYLYHNWWPLLSGILYVLVPMPYLFFGGSGGGYSMNGSTSSGWRDAGNFLVGASAVGAIAIPSVLAHAKVIEIGALIMQLAAAVTLGSTVVVWDYFTSREDLY